MTEDFGKETTPDELVLYVKKLPYDVEKKQVIDVFRRFGRIVELHMKRREALNSNVFLENPYVVLVFENPQVINEIMASRPFHLNGQELLLRRSCPHHLRTGTRWSIISKKALVRLHDEQSQEILPNDDLILEYLQQFGGQIEYSERLDNRTFLVQFNDYDLVDLAYFSSPHFIGQQSVLIERCLDEQQVRLQIEGRLKNDDFLTNSNLNEHDDAFHSFSPQPVLLAEDPKGNFMMKQNERISEIEREHGEKVRQLKDELRSIIEERIRFQRSTLDFEHERDRLLDENRTWQKLYSDSIQEKPQVQKDGEEILNEIRAQISMLTKGEN